MIVKTVKAYFCDYCNKKYYSASWCSRHEARCTMNPDRECMFCEKVLGQEQPDMRELIKKYSGKIEFTERDEDFSGVIEGGIIEGASFIGKNKFSIKDIQSDCDGCPACTLAVLRQSGLAHHLIYPLIGEFDYEKEKQAVWSAINEEEARREMW